MNDTKSLPVITTVFFISLLTLFYFSENIDVLIYSISIGISVIVLPFSHTSLGFFLLLVQILGIGFYNTLNAFYFSASNTNQLMVISEYTLYTVCLSTLWLTFHILKILKTEQAEMKNTIEQLKKYETSVHVFTRTEFLSIAKFILTGMKRRDEKGYLLTLKINKDKRHIQESIFHSLAMSILESIRADYDLAGKLSDDSIMVLLQNTNEEGCQIVIKRIEENIGKILHLESEPFSIEIQELDDEMFLNLSKVEVTA